VRQRHLVDQRTLGIIRAGFIDPLLVMVKIRLATGSILDKPRGNLVMQADNIFNLCLFADCESIRQPFYLVSRGLPANDPTM
jgi:hypothetical protein